MAFTVLLLISISTLVQVESQGSAIQMKTLKAEQNALLGMQVALGRLQKSAGRDRATTATIEVDSELAVDPTKKYWTGVWNNPGSYDAARNLMEYGNAEGEAELSAILVSFGEEPSDLDLDLSTEADQNWPILLGASTVDRERDAVRVPAMDIEPSGGTGRGRFAYWVGDEGVKARVDLADPAALPESDPKYQEAGSLVRLLSPPRTGTGRMRLDEAPVGTEFSTNPDLLSRLGDIDSLAFVFDAGERFAQDRFHDLTVHSEGLLTDQRLGGLRRDLTWMLREDALPDGYLYKEPVSANHIDQEPNGPAWSLLQDYYRKAVPGSLTPAEEFLGRDAEDASDHRTNLSPLVTQVKLYFNFAFGPAVAGHGGKLRMYLFPVVVLHNPYNRQLAAADYRLQFIQHNTEASTELEVQTFDEFGDPVRRFEGDGYKFKDFRNALFDPKGSSSGSDNSGSIFFHVEDLGFEPGETRVLTLAEADEYLGPLNSSHIQGAAHRDSNPDGNRLVPGFNDSNSAYVEFADALEEDEEPEFYQFELINPGNIRFALSKTNVAQSRLVLLTVGYNDFRDPSILQIGPRLTRSDTTFPRAGFTYAFDLGKAPHLADFNLRAAVISRVNAYELTGGDQRTPRLYKGAFGIGDFSTDVSDPDSGVGFFGTSHTTSGFERTVLFEVPESPEEFISIGQLKQLDLSIRTNPNVDESNHNAPAYVLGNSRADPRVGTELSFNDTGTASPRRFGAAFDQSYRANEALWDGFFFATSPSVEDEPPLNRRLCPKSEGWESPDDAVAAAESLVIEGAFNINSVSVDAWRALLAGLQNHNLQTVRAGIQNDNDFIFGSMLRPLDGVFQYEGQAATDEAVWNRARSLKAEEIDILAEAIVNEVRERGPFLSLAHFINRSLGAPSDFTEKGALQAAIDLAGPDGEGPGLNDGLGGDSVDPSYIDMDVPSPELFADHAFDGAPGRLTQADLLSALGPILSARSDTFRIRGYGESDDLDNSSKALCEAIVRRIPAKVDPNEAIEVPSPADTFGRRFEIVSFRWLPPQTEPTAP